MYRLMALVAFAAISFLSPALVSAQDATPSPEAQFTEECSACHLAYPAFFLPKESWSAIMNTLPDHFGEDASLDDGALKAIEGYLVKHAARSNRRAFRKYDLETAPPLRITELGWFTHEHDHEVSRSAKKRAGSMSNCAACHRGAERGYFDDD